jgi:hypothetical protein
VKLPTSISVHNRERTIVYTITAWRVCAEIATMLVLFFGAAVVNVGPSVSAAIVGFAVLGVIGAELAPIKRL